MRSSVDRNDFEAVVSLCEHDDELRCLNDLPEESFTVQTHIQSTECGRNTSQRRIVFIAECFGLLYCPRLVQARKRWARLTRSTRRRRCRRWSGSRSGCGTIERPDLKITTTPPYARQIRMTVRH